MTDLAPRSLNCMPDISIANAQFGNNTRCSPFGGASGHTTNCTAIAEQCYKGYVATPPFNATDGVTNQIIYVGSLGQVVNQQEFYACVQSAVGDGVKFDRGFSGDARCRLVASETGGSANAAEGRKRWNGAMMLTVLVVGLSVISSFAAVPHA